MRVKFLLGILGFGALALGALVLISPRGGGTSTRQPIAPAFGAVAPGAEPQPEEKAGLTGRPEASLGQARPAAQAKGAASQIEESDAHVGGAKHEAYVEARIAELQDLSRKTDAASLETLLSEIKNQDQEIRQAALDAITQSGNRSAIPGLQEAAAQTEDAAGKQAIDEVIEFLKLPTLTELLRNQGETNNKSASPNPP